MARRDSYEISQHGDNTYATIQPRNVSQLGEIADYATLRNNSRPPSVSSFNNAHDSESFLQLLFLFKFKLIDVSIWIEQTMKPHQNITYCLI